MTSVESKPSYLGIRAMPHLLQRSWADETVVFDPRTGDTHILQGPSALLLRDLIDSSVIVELASTGPASRSGTVELADVEVAKRHLLQLGLLQHTGD